MAPNKSGFSVMIFIITVGIFGLQFLFIYAVFLSYTHNELASKFDSIYTLTHNLYSTVHFQKSIKATHINIIANGPNKDLIERLIGQLPATNHTDLRYRSKKEIQARLSTIFNELPPDGKFIADMKNPCWKSKNAAIICLPYAYILGQPKCGTTDLFIRIVSHDHVKGPRRKEVRWFTRGEFSEELKRPQYLRIGPETSILSFTSHFNQAAKFIPINHKLITIDGGPHTLWWPLQAPDGTLFEEDIPPPQILREIQNNAKFIITLTDPVKRMYSDYNFLDDNLLPATEKTIKTAQEFHERVVLQINNMGTCLIGFDLHTDKAAWFRKSQICAHDRHQFAVGGWGRLSIGMYIVFIVKWLEHFPLQQFLFLRLSDFDKNPTGYMRKVFQFLELDEPSPENWSKVLRNFHANTNFRKYEPMLPETEKLLREFYQPYNDLLMNFMRNSNGFQESLDVILTNNHDLRPIQGQNIILPNQHDAIPRDVVTPQIVPEHYKLRRKGKSEESGLVLLNPLSFNITDLPFPYTEEDPPFNAWLSRALPRDQVFTYNADAALALCVAAFGLDVAAIKYLLYNVGISPRLHLQMDGERTALHCLSLVEILADANSKSYIFALLKAKPNWLTPVLDPPLPLQSRVPMASDIVASMENPALRIAQWLIRAGADVNDKDIASNTPLHLAANGGLCRLVQFFLESGADPNAINRELRTPLHNAAAMGHVQIGILLVRAGADLDKRDAFGVSPRDILENPGPVTKEDARLHFNVTQRGVREIGRIIHPELFPSNPMGWKAGTGGWGAERLEGTTEDMHCDIDQYLASEITGDELFEKYLARNSPVLIRGLLDDWPLVKSSTREKLTEEHGGMKVLLSEVPYADKFGGTGEPQVMTLAAYLEQVHDHRVRGEKRPYYLFKGHSIPQTSESNDSMVPYHLCPTPQQIYECVHRVPSSPMIPTSVRGAKIDGHKRREHFINAQWAVGMEGSGAPIHFHNAAWSALIYGAKKWILYPPRNMIMSNEHILDFMELHMKDLEKRGIYARTCVQTAGDVILIPESWGHGVVNIQESVAVATELIEAVWRTRPAPSVLQQVPNDNKPPPRQKRGPLSKQGIS